MLVINAVAGYLNQSKGYVKYPAGERVGMSIPSSAKNIVIVSLQSLNGKTIWKKEDATHLDGVGVSNRNSILDESQAANFHRLLQSRKHGKGVWCFTTQVTVL